MIYENKELAKKALFDLYSKTEKLLDEYGAWIEASDSCCSIFWCVDYKDENGKVRSLTSL